VSLILDALNRSRQDADPVPGLGSQHHVQPPTTERRFYLLWAALALAIAVIAWLAVDRWRAPPSMPDGINAPVAQLSRNLDSAVVAVTTQLKERAAATEQAQQAEVQPPPAFERVEPVPPAAPTPTTAAVAPEPVPTGRSQAVAAAAPAPSREADSDAVAQLYRNRNVPEPDLEPRKPARAQQQTASAQEEDAVDLEQILKLAQEEMKNVGLDEHPVPFLADLSQQTKDGIPTIYYQKHDYSSDPSVSSVVLNGNVAKVGGSPLPGLKVEEILRDSVVLSYHGTQFRLRALNSWINL